MKKVLVLYNKDSYKSCKMLNRLLLDKEVNVLDISDVTTDDDIDILEVKVSNIEYDVMFLYLKTESVELEKKLITRFITDVTIWSF